MNAKILVSKHFAVGKIDPRIYGSFVEHMGRCVYGPYQTEEALLEYGALLMQMKKSVLLGNTLFFMVRKSRKAGA